jgi:putative acyl-CoA dehydrogenase
MGAVRAFAKPGKADEDGLAAFGRRWGQADMAELGRLANENPPTLRAFDSRGFRADVVEFHPAYHALMKSSMAAGLHASTWGEGGRAAAGNAHVLRAAKLHMAGEVEAGHLCPIVMTHAATAALIAEPALVEEWLPRIRSRDYDASFRPASEKTSVTLGMGMTEKQGGTDVRANTSHAEVADGAYRIIGHKWFMSAPMCDAFLVLAQAEGGLTCFLVPRFQPDGSVNALKFNRLKDKLGNRSNASSEVEFEGACALRCGKEGDGIRTIIRMVQLTRLDCAVASAGLMRGALAFAIHHVRYRVFSRRN